MKQPYVALAILALSWAPTCRVDAQTQNGVIAGSAPVTLAPDEGRTPLATLREGTWVKLLSGEENGWYRVSFRDTYLGERVGYVRREHLRIQGATNPANSQTDLPITFSSVTIIASPKVDNGAANVRRSSTTLSTNVIEEALAFGHREALRSHGLSLHGSPGAASAGFRVQVHTPITWIRQLAGDAARQNRRLTPRSLTEDITAPVFRITAYADTTVAAPSSGGSVRHVTLRSDSEPFVVQPLTKETVTEEVPHPGGGRAVLEGLHLTFPLDAVRDLRGPRRDREVSIVVIGASGEEVIYKLTKKLFDDLPM